MVSNAKAMVLASFLADSLALGAHWIYDTKKIISQFGKIDSLLKPLSDSYHHKKEKGELTHYGDQMLVLLKSIVVKKDFYLNDFFDRWLDLFNDYEGYVDQATRVTISNYFSGKNAEDAGSSSDDLGGAARIAAIVYCNKNGEEKMVKNVRAQTRMTHNNPLPIDSAEFFGRLAKKVLDGTSPVKGIEEITEKHFSDSPISSFVKKGIESRGRDTIEAIKDFGQSCHVEEAFPGTVHIISKYGDNLRGALIQNVMAGGDSAARGMMVGMIIGAFAGYEDLPSQWLDDFRYRDKIEMMLEELD
jgi:ADP-ribosylglycohydrolase